MTDKIIEAARESRLGAVLCHNSIEGDRVWIEGADWHDELSRFYGLAYRQALEDAAKVATQIDLESQGVLPIRVALISSRIAKSILALKEQQHG